MGAAAGLARLIHQLGDDPPASQGCELREALDPIRGIEGLGAKIYFSVFQYMLKQQREDFRFVTRTRRTAPRPDKLLAFLYLCPGPSRLFGRADDRGTGPIRRMAPCDARREARLRPGSDGRISAVFSREAGVPVVSKNTNELKTGAPGPFRSSSTRGEPQIWGSEAMSAIRVPRTRRESTVQQRDATAPGRRPGPRHGPHLDQNVLAGYATVALALILDPSDGLFSDAARPCQRARSPIWRKRGTRKSRLETKTEK